MDVHFDLFKPEMKSQVDFLDRQIDQAVVELRLTAGVHNQSILDIVKQIDSNLDRLRDQNKELRAAFRQMKAIRNRLELLSLGINSVDLYEKVSLAREFFPEVKLRLSLIDRRLDRIHPKLRQFFSTLNKPLFNSRVEKFLGYLLNHSSLEYSKGKKVLVLPPNVSLPQLNISVPRLPILERKENLFPARARTVQDFDEDHQQTERLWKSLRSSLQVQDEIEEWHERIINDVKAKSSVRFSDYFFNLAERKQGSFELPIKLAHRFIKSGFLLPAYTIDVKDEIIQNEKFPGVAICEMNIYLK